MAYLKNRSRDGSRPSYVVCWTDIAGPNANGPIGTAPAPTPHCVNGSHKRSATNCRTKPPHVSRSRRSPRHGWRRLGVG
jgi:hypothetical protein